MRMLMATTALATLLATGAIAQDSSSSSMMDSSAMSSEVMSSDASAMDSSMMDTSMSSEPMDSAMSSEPMDTMSSAPMDSDTAVVAPRTPVDILSGYTRVDTDQLVTKVIGAPVYSSAADDADHLGDINDLVLNQNGDIAAVVLGVGGFLGIGEKQVAVDYSALQKVVAADNTTRYVLQTTVDDLTNAPDFVTTDDSPADGAATGGAADMSVSSSAAM